MSIKEPKLATTTTTKPVPSTAKYHCDACGVDASTEKMESVHIEGYSVIRCVNPRACRQRWTNAS